MVGHSLLYIESRLHLCLLRKSIGTWSFEHGNKGQSKVYKIENLVTTWAGPADRGKTKTCQGSADPRSALFTYNERSGRRCRSKELPLVCEKNYNKMILIEVSVYS